MIDSVGEVHPVDFFTVDSLVVHRAEDEILLGNLGIVTKAFLVDLRRSGHVKALATLNILVRVDLRKQAVVLGSETDAGGTVRFVADDEVKHTVLAFRLLEKEFLGIADSIDGLICGEHDHKSVVIAVAQQLLGNSGCTGGCGEGEV